MGDCVVVWRQRVQKLTPAELRLFANQSGFTVNKDYLICICFAVISCTFPRDMLDESWKLRWARLASVQHQERNKHATAHVWNMWPNGDKKERLVYCSFHSLGFEILLFESCFEGTYGCCCCFENRLIKVYLYTWKVQNACPRAYVFKFFSEMQTCIIRWFCWKSTLTICRIK